jgi:hypothetical protein
MTRVRVRITADGATTDVPIDDAARLLRIPLRRLRGWLDRGILVLEQPAGRRGQSRHFTWDDLGRAARLIAAEREWRLARQIAARRAPLERRVIAFPLHRDAKS